MEESPDLRGLIAATVTPMREDRAIDEPSLRRYLAWLAEQGVSGLALNVDTGEGPHLYPEERLRVLEVAAEEVGDRVVIVSGLAASFTDQACRMARDLGAAGAKALLVFPISAYQGEPLDPEIPARYHKAIYEAAGVPLIAFQLQPALGGVSFSAEAIAAIIGTEGVVAIKEASFDAKRFVETLRAVRTLSPEKVVLNGNDNFLLEAYLLGADGALLGFGTLGASDQVAMRQAVSDLDYAKAQEFGARLQALCDVIFAPPVRSYRARLKHALLRLGVIETEAMRPPLLQLDEHEQDLVDEALKSAGVL
ncbi:MAG: dihydrodipicolinate synthase family protein [Nitrososphaerales archaeon]